MTNVSYSDLPSDLLQHIQRECHSRIVYRESLIGSRKPASRLAVRRGFQPEDFIKYGIDYLVDEVLTDGPRSTQEKAMTSKQAFPRLRVVPCFIGLDRRKNRLKCDSCRIQATCFVV